MLLLIRALSPFWWKSENVQYMEEKGFQKEKEPDLGHSMLTSRATTTRAVHLDGRKAAECSTESSELWAILSMELSLLLSIKNVYKQQRSGTQWFHRFIEDKAL